MVMLLLVGVGLLSPQTPECVYSEGCCTASPGGARLRTPLLSFSAVAGATGCIDDNSTISASAAIVGGEGRGRGRRGGEGRGGEGRGGGRRGGEGRGGEGRGGERRGEGRGGEGRGGERRGEEGGGEGRGEGRGGECT